MLVLPRTTQPQGPVPINQANPLTRDICFAIYAAGGAIGMVRGRPGNIISTGRTVTKHGQAWLPTTAANDAGLDFGVVQPLQNGTQHTIFAIAAPRADATQYREIVSQRSNATGDQIALIANLDTIAGNQGRLTLYSFDAGGPDTHIISDNAVCDGTLKAFGVSKSSVSAGAIYVNGDAVASSVTANVGGSTNPITTAQSFKIGNGADYSASSLLVHDDPIVLVLAWNRVLSAAEHRALALNPWQVFAPIPPRRMVTAAAPSFNAAWNVAANTVINSGANVQ